MSQNTFADIGRAKQNGYCGCIVTDQLKVSDEKHSVVSLLRFSPALTEYLESEAATTLTRMSIS
eukprot:5299863-Amphidinium_carterae.1